MNDMNLRILPALAIFAATLFSACSPSEPFRTGHDSRVFNPTTGRYEWPDETPEKRAQLAGSRHRSTASSAPAEKKENDDGRSYNLQKSRFE